jgi:stage II sporulation protein GA (sporulation sigma-E factor processing peptidase)
VEIYPDIIFLENIVMNYFILLVAAKLSKSTINHLRLFGGAFAGATYVLVMIFMPSIKVYYSATAKIGLSFLIVAISFYPKGVKEFIKKIIVFYISSFMFAGATFALIYFNKGGGIVKNGIVVAFGERTLTILVLAAGLVGISAMVIRELLQNRLVKGDLHSVTLCQIFLW